MDAIEFKRIAGDKSTFDRRARESVKQIQDDKRAKAGGVVMASQ